MMKRRKANDEDGNGLISNKRIEEIFHDLGVEANEEQVKNFFSILDPQGTGISNYQQFEDVDLGVDWLF